MNSGIAVSLRGVLNWAVRSLCTRITAAVLVSLPLLVGTPAFSQRFFLGWTISEFQPDIKNGGRANTIAVNPTNNNIILVASESGGLFQTTDRGITWHHVDSLQEFSTNSVAYVPANPNVVLITVNADFRVNNGGGIWRSTDGGSTWTQIPIPTAPAGDTERFSAWEISIAPDTGKIYVGTTYGLAISSDQGATWTMSDPFSFSDHHVLSVTAQSGNLILTGSPSGIRRSTDGGATWLSPSAGNVGVWDIHSYGRSPYSATQAYVSSGGNQLLYTEDGGDHWTQIASAPGGGGSCGGIAFVKPIARTIFRKRPFPPLHVLDLYYGNRCGLAKLTANPIPNTGRFDYSGTWTTLIVDHGDMRDLAFDNFRNPLLLGTDGGLHNTADGGAHWNFVGGGHFGYDALQITEVRGQWISDVANHDLYFGTQDNNLWTSGDDGVTWTNPFCCEGFFIERLNRVATASDSKINFVSCGACGDWSTNPLFAGATPWPDAPNLTGNPKIVSKGFYVQAVNDSASLNKGLASTSNLGASWQQYARFPEDVRDLPKQSRWLFLPVLYQSIRTGWDATDDFEINHLVAISRNLFFPGTTVRYPSMNNFGGLGINPTMFAWYQVFGVDPMDSSHLIAPDVVNHKMMETHDGANNWTEIPQLTSLVTNSGDFLFNNWIFPHASAVSFSPDDPNTVAVGTWQGGIMISGDRGATWSKVPGSEKVTYITSFDWRTSTDAIVSTYGRGLWHLKWLVIIPWKDFEAYCYLPCRVDPLGPDRGDPYEKYQEGIMVFDGLVQGVRVANGTLEELFVSPGSSVAYVSESKEIHNIKVTETKKQVGFTGLGKEFHAPERNYQTVGFMLGREGRLRASVFSQRQLSMTETQAVGREETERQEKEQESAPEQQRSPTAGKPYTRITTGHGPSANMIASGRPVGLAGSDFKPGTNLEIALDGKTVEKATVGQDGTFSVSVKSPQVPGLHRITIRDAETGQVIDGVMFIVRSEDERGHRKGEPENKRENQAPRD